MKKFYIFNHTPEMIGKVKQTYIFNEKGHTIFEFETDDKDGEYGALIINKGRINVFIEYSKILYIKAKGDFANVFMDDGEVFIRVTLKEVFDELKHDYFKYANRGEIVNLLKMEEYSYKLITLAGDIPIQIGRTFQKEWHEMFGEDNEK